MTRHAHPVAVQPQPASNLQVDQGKGDGDPPPRFQHPVQETVIRIIIVLSIAGEAGILEQIPGEAPKESVLGGGCERQLLGFGSQEVQSGQIAFDVQRGVMFAGQIQSATSQVLLLLGQL